MLARVLVLAFASTSTLALAIPTPALSPIDGGSPAFSDTIYATCPDAPPVIVLDGGVAGEAFAGWRLMHPDRAARVACLMQTCEVDRKLREVREDAAPPPWWWVGSVSVALGLAVAAFFLGRSIP
jgi:hypothetical protein